MNLEKAFNPRETRSGVSRPFDVRRKLANSRNNSKYCSVLFAHRTGESLKLNITLNLFVFFCDFRGQTGVSG